MPRTALPLLALLLAVGCASAPESKPADNASAAANSGNECDAFTEKLCAAVGDDTEPCAAMRSMQGWLPETACAAADADISGVQARITELRSKCVELGEKLCAELGTDTEECASVRQDMPRVPAGHCAMLLARFPQLVEQLKERVARSKPLADDVWKELLAGNAPSFGPASAKVQIVEFSDFECPYCSQAAAVVEQIREKYGGEVHLVFRQFPLSFHRHAEGAAKAALAAHAQGKFWPMHDRLFENQAQLAPADLEAHAKHVGLDVAAFTKSMGDSAIEEQLNTDLALGRKAGVDGTPAMFIDGKRVDNATDFDEVAPLIDAALAK